MESNQPRIRSLMRQAVKVEEAGKRSAAEQLYRQVLDEAPDIEAAWLGVARTTSDVSDQEAAYGRVLELNPENIEAKVGLADMRGEPVPEAWRISVTPKVEPEPLSVVEVGKVKPTAVPVSNGNLAPSGAASDDTVTYDFACYRHPERGTSLRCYNCGKPICVSCANKTSVGYLCPDCKRELEDKFFNANPLDYLIAALVSFPLSLIAGILVWKLGGGIFFIFIMVFVGGFVGGVIGKATKKAIGGRRGRYLPHLVVAMMILGVLIPAFPLLLTLLMSGPAAITAGAGLVLTFVTPGVYLFVACGSAFYWMK